MEKVTLTVIMAMYNTEEFVAKAIDSVLSQTFTDFELIILDDGSTDKSREIAKEFMEQDSRVRLLSGPNRGVAQTRQIGVDLARGEYIIFVDSDDWIQPRLFQHIMDAFKSSREVDVVRFQSKLTNDEPEKDHDRYNWREHTNCLVKGMESLKAWSKSGIKYAVYWLFAFRKSHLAQFKMDPELRCFEDVSTIPLIIASARWTVTIDYVGYVHENNMASITNRKDINSERKRAIDFIKASKIVTTGFRKIDGVTEEDIEFFNDDFARRLRGMYDTLPTELKEELIVKFDEAITDLVPVA